MLKALRQAALFQAHGSSKAAASGGNSYRFGVATGFGAATAFGAVAPPVAPSSIPNVQCASTFFPSDFALTITVQDLSRSFCVT